MEHFAGIDVSLEQSSVCVVDATGKIVREAKVAGEPEGLVRFFRELGVAVSRIGLEAGPLSQWLHAGLAKTGFDAVLLETRQVKAALSAMVVKTEGKDARGIAQLLRMGWFRPVHAKSPAAQEIHALLVARKLLPAKLLDMELSIRGILRGFGRKMGEVSKARFVAGLSRGFGSWWPGGRCWSGSSSRCCEPARRCGSNTLSCIAASGDAEHRQARCRVSAADDRTRRRRAGGDHLHISGGRPWAVRQVESRGRAFRADPEEVSVRPDRLTGGISRVGDAMVRAVLYAAAHIMLSRETRFSSLKRWTLDLAKRRDLKRAKVALARKLATVLHRMWLDGADFRWGREVSAAA